MDPELADYILTLPAVDAHEHLLPERERLAVRPDAVWLFHQYAISDLQSAGMPVSEAGRIRDPDEPLERKWRVFKPWWDAIRHTGFGRAVRTALRDLYGFDDLNDGTVGPLSEAVAAANTPGLTHRFLGEAGRIHTILNNNNLYEQPVPYAHPLVPVVRLQADQPWADLEDLENGSGIEITDPESLHVALDRRLERHVAHGVVGLKMTAGAFPAEPDTRAVASVLRRIRNRHPVEPDDLEALIGCMRAAVLKRAAHHDLTVAVHCGFFSGVNADFTRSRATLLIPLLLKYPDTRFDLFHLGYPWIEEVVALAKAFTNVNVNLCWAHAINPPAAQRAMVELAHSVPVTKVLAMGGDVWRLPDVAYGHLKLARQGVARSLSDCLARGWLDRDEARHIARLWLSDNAPRIYPRLKANQTLF